MAIHNVDGVTSVQNEGNSYPLIIFMLITAVQGISNILILYELHCMLWINCAVYFIIIMQLSELAKAFTKIAGNNVWLREGDQQYM